MVKIELGLDMTPPSFGKSMWMWNQFVLREYNKKKLKEDRLKKLKKLNNYE